MASDIRIPDPVTIKKQEDEDSYLINEQGNKLQKEIYTMEEEKLDLLSNQPPGVGDFPSSVDTIDAEFSDGIKTKDNEILVTSKLEQGENEEKCGSDHCPTGIPKEDETEMLDNEKQFDQCDHTGDAKEKEEYEAVEVDEQCENSIQKIDEQEALPDIKTSSPVSKVEEDIIAEKEKSINEKNVEQNFKEILDPQTFEDNNDKPQNMHEERNESELELKKEASAESTINILNDDIENVTTNAEDSPSSRGILDEEDVGTKTERKVGDNTEISCDSKVEKVIETSIDTELEKNEEPSTSNADHALNEAISEVQNDETTTEIRTSTENKLEMLSALEDTDGGSKQEGMLEEGVNLSNSSAEFTNETETHEESTQDNSIPHEGDEAEFSEQKLESINVERQVDLQEMTESTANESREVEELTATETGDYIDGSQNSKAEQDPEHKYFEENDLAEETTLAALNKSLVENETETPREISETISNEGEKQITNPETSSGIEKEHIEAAYFGASKDDVPTEEELSPSNLDEVHDSTNELSDNNGNDIQLEHSLLRETEKVEDQKVDEVLEFENEQKFEEEKAVTEEEKYVDDVAEAYPNTENTTGEFESLDKTLTSEMISEINSSTVEDKVEDEKISGFSLEEKIESSEIRSNVPEESESNNDTETSTSVQKIIIKDDKTDEQIAVDDALNRESRNADEEDIIEKSFEEKDYEEATLNLIAEDENLLPNEIEKKKTYDEEGSDNIDTTNINEEALVKSKDACFSPETNEVEVSSEKEVEKLTEEDSGRSIFDEADEKYVGEEVIKHYKDENEDIEISKGEILSEVENVTGEKFITNEKNEDVETQEDVSFSEEHDVLATKETVMEESRNDYTSPTEEVVAGNAVDYTSKNNERAMEAEEVAEKVLDEGQSKEELINFLVARESETETLSENDQIISAAEKDTEQKDDSGGQLIQPLVIDETETEDNIQNAYNETLAVEELEETKQSKTEACFDCTGVAEKDTEQISRKDETSEEVKQSEFSNEIEEKASCDNAENETPRDDDEQISHQEETEELEQSLETKTIETDVSCRDAEIIKLEDDTEKDFLNEVKESEASCADIEITVPKEDAEQVLLKEATNDIEQPQSPNETETEVFSDNVKEILPLEELQETKTFEPEASSDGTKVADKDIERSLEKVETSEEVQQLQLSNAVEEKTFCNDAEEISIAREDTTQILHQGEPKELDCLGETKKIESEEQCEDEEVIAHEEDTQPVVLQEVTKELDQSLVPNENEMDAFSDNSEIVVDTKQTSQNVESVEEFENVLETEETEKEDNNPVIIGDTKNLQKDETREVVKELLFTSELQEKPICDIDEKQTLIAEDYAKKDSETNLQTYETKEEIGELINANGTETEVFHGDIETTLADKDIDKICQKNESTEEIEPYLEIKEYNAEGLAEGSGIERDERNFEETLQQEESGEELEQMQPSRDIETEEKVCGETEIDTVMGERGLEDPFEIGQSSEKFEQSIVTPEPAVKKDGDGDGDEDITLSIGGEETAKEEVIETARECQEHVIPDEISNIESQPQETNSKEITTKDFQKDENEGIGYKELEIEDVTSIEQENTTGTLSSTPINETITESFEKENSDTVELKQELQVELKEQIEEQNLKEISTENIPLQEEPDTKALDEEIQKEERSENLAQNFSSESKVTEEEMQEEIQEKGKADSSLVTILSEEEISKEELEIKELSNEEGTDLGTSSTNLEEERDSKSENEKDKDISLVANETENQSEYETDDQVHHTAIINDQEVTIDEVISHHTPDYKLTDLSALPTKELDIETTEASNEPENVTIDAACEYINEQVENPLKEKEIENKLVQEADESSSQSDLSEMGSSDISAPSEVQEQRDEELHPLPDTENQIEYEVDDQQVIIEEATSDHTPDYKVTDLSTLTSKGLDTATEAGNARENVTTDAEGEAILNEKVENPLTGQDIEEKLVQEADESFIQRDLGEMGSLDISAPSEVPQQRDEELHPPPKFENQIEYEGDNQVHLTTIKNDQEVIIEEGTLEHTPDYKVTDPSASILEELDIETTEASNATENVTIDAEGKDFINEEVENPVKEQEIEYKLVEEADESFAQRDLSEIGSSDIVPSSASSDVQQQRDEELNPPSGIDRRNTFDSNEVANLNKEELIDFEKQHEVIDDKTCLESEEAGEDETKQILQNEESEEFEQLLESKITETEAYADEIETGESHQDREVIKTVRECKEDVISDEIDSTKSQSPETGNDEIALEYFQKDGTDEIGYKEPETEHTSLTEQENFEENTTASLSSMPINETTTESSENEINDALKLKQELQLGSAEQIEEENWNELQKDLDTKEPINEDIYVEEKSDNVAQNLLSESKVYEPETQEKTQEKEDSDASFVAISGIDLSEMGSDQKSEPSEVQKQRDPELHPPPEIYISTSESNEVANLDKEDLADLQNQYKVADDKNNLQSEELEEIIFENPREVVDDKNNRQTEEAAQDDFKNILRNEKSTEEIEQLMETKTTVNEALVAEKDTTEGLQETETSIGQKDITEVLEHTEPYVFDKDSSAPNEIEKLKKEELDFENEYEFVDEKNNLELDGETSQKEAPSEQLNDQYFSSDKPPSDLKMTSTDFEEPSRSIELAEATAAGEVVSQGAGQDDYTVQFSVLPTKEAKETNLESNIQIEATEAVNEETSNQTSNENYVASYVSEMSDEEVQEVVKDEIITDDCKPLIANYESENSGLNVAESEETCTVEDNTVFDSIAIDNKPESEQKDVTDMGTVLNFATERRETDIDAEVEGKEGGEYEMEEKLGILTEDTCTKEGNKENLDSTESKMPAQDYEEEITINDNDYSSAKFGSDLSLMEPESKKPEIETKEDQSVIQITQEDISILCKEEAEDTTTRVAEGIDNRDHNIEETTPTKQVVEENIFTRSLDIRSDDNTPESVEILSDKDQLVETETEEKVEDVVRDEATYGNFEPEEKLNNPTEDTCTKEGNENLTASTESEVFDEKIKEEIISKEEISTSDFDSASTKFESQDVTLESVESEEQKIQASNDQSAIEIKPEDNPILCKDNDDETTTLGVESMVNQDHDIEAMSPDTVIVEENNLTRSIDFTSDSNLQETIEIPSSKNQLLSNETSEDLSLQVVESEEQEIQGKEDQTAIDTKQEDEDIVTLVDENTENRKHDIEETIFKGVVDENVLNNSFDSTGANLQDSAEISSDKHELLANKTMETVVSEETEHVMDEVDKAVVEGAFLTTSSDTLDDNDCHDSSAVLSEDHLPAATGKTEEKVSKGGIDDSTDNFNELELSKGQVEISTVVGQENDVIEQEEGYNSKDNTLDLGEEKAAIFRDGDQGQTEEVAEINEKSLLEEKNVEFDDSSARHECSAELVNEDQNIQLEMSEAEEDINPTSVEQQVLEQPQEDEITSTNVEDTVTNEKVCDEIIKNDSREHNEEQVIENKSTLEELHMISSQGAVNEFREVSEDYMREINSNEKVNPITSEYEQDITSEREINTTDTTQEERVMGECMEPPTNISVSISEESEEKITGKIKNDLEKLPSPSNETTTPSTSEKPIEVDASFETNAKVTPSLSETKEAMDNPNTSNIPFKVSTQASEYEQEILIDDVLSKSKDSEIEDEPQGIAVTSSNTTENEYEKTVEECKTTENEVPDEEELEQNKFKEDHNQILFNENSNKNDVAEEINEPLKSTSEVYYQDVVKVPEVTDEGATEKEKAEECKMLDEVTKKESFAAEENNEYLKEEKTEVDLEIQGNTETITKEEESRVDMSGLKGPDNAADDNIISKDIYQIKEIAPEIYGKKLNQTEEISKEVIKTKSVGGDVSPIVNSGQLTEPPIENEGQEGQDIKEEDREVQEHGDSSKDTLYEVRAEEFVSTDLEKAMSAKQNQSSTIENELIERTMAENTEQIIKSEEHEDGKIEGAHDSGTDEEKGDKHDKDAVSDAPVIVEASKDIDVKVGHKKSHNILSGVGSKVKHSISKVKKAITGKSSHHKSESPK